MHLHPILLRLAWHASETYDRVTNTGGSGTGSMRFEAESNTEDNKGVDIAKSFGVD